MAQGLAACGVKVAEGKDSLTVTAAARRRAGGVQHRGEARPPHRHVVPGAGHGRAKSRSTIDDGRGDRHQLPGFVDLMNGLGAMVTKTNR